MKLDRTKYINQSIKALVATNIEPILDTEERTFTCIMTSELVDREGEVVLVDGIQLSEFQLLSPLLYNHDIGDPIGKVIEVSKRDGYVVAKCMIGKNTKSCDDTWELIKQGIIGAVSIGFIPLEIRQPTRQDIERYGDEVQVVISKCKLVELSVVAVPANHYALISQISAKHFKKDIVEVKKVKRVKKSLNINLDNIYKKEMRDIMEQNRIEQERSIEACVKKALGYIY